MNQITLLGRLTRDPEVKYTQSGKVVAQFGLAVDRPYKDAEGKREADFIPIVVWGKSAETAGKYLAKGRRLLVEGRLQIRSYDDKNGVKRYVSEVIASRFEFIDAAPAAAPAVPAAAAPAASPSEAVPDFASQIPFSEEIPF